MKQYRSVNVEDGRRKTKWGDVPATHIYKALFQSIPFLLSKTMLGVIRCVIIFEKVGHLILLWFQAIREGTERDGVTGSSFQGRHINGRQTRGEGQKNLDYWTFLHTTIVQRDGLDRKIDKSYDRWRMFRAPTTSYLRTVTTIQLRKWPERREKERFEGDWLLLAAF